MKVPRVLLGSMPWASLGEPSLGLGILAAQLRNKSINVCVRHFNVFLLNKIRPQTYVLYANTYALNEFLFSSIIESGLSEDQEAALDLLVERVFERSPSLNLRFSDRDELKKQALYIRNILIPEYISECVKDVDAYQPTMLGLTCMYDQTIPSIALAKAVKESRPDTLVVLGGYAIEGAVGPQILKSFPWIDAVAQGEGEHVIEHLAEISIGNRPVAISSKILFNERCSNDSKYPTTFDPGFVDLNNSATPDFDDFFNDIEELHRISAIEIIPDRLPVESSRGCWWGQRSHCTFCGIDDETIKYRKRDPEGVIRMLDSLRDRYGLQRFRFSDYILPFNFYKTLLRSLADESYNLSCEIKANVNSEQVKALADAGFTEVQPGIESFSSDVLKLMRKGVSGAQNILTLKLGSINRIKIHYNILYSFPNEPLKEYRAMVKLLPLLYHLDPPGSILSVQITRFSPMQVTPEAFGTKRTSHSLEYDVIFSKKFLEDCEFDLDDYCYYFEIGHENTEMHKIYYSMLEMQVEHWRRIHAVRRPMLYWFVLKDQFAVYDNRYDEQGKTHLFPIEYQDLYKCMDLGVATRNKLSKVFINNEHFTLDDALSDLLQARLAYEESGEYIALANECPSEQQSVLELLSSRSLTKRWRAVSTE